MGFEDVYHESNQGRDVMFNIVDERGQNLWFLARDSNVGINGMWIYTISESIIQEGET